MYATIVSADELKKELSGYTPEHAEEFHERSAHMADERFDVLLKFSVHPKVVLMSGGPASGKTEFIAAYLHNQNLLVFDGILPTEKGAQTKISKVRKSKKDLAVYAVWPIDIKAAYAAFLNRDRKFNDRHFYEKHATARRTLLWIAEHYSDIEVKVFMSVYRDGKLHFDEVVASREDLVAYIRKNQYDKDAIIKIVSQ